MSDISKETTFTRGPWVSQGWVPTWAYIPVHGPGGRLICSLYPDEGHGYTRSEVERDAAIAAAAPELYAVVADFMENPNFRVAVGGNPNAVDELMARARNALAKARGEDRSHEGK